MEHAKVLEIPFVTKHVRLLKILLIMKYAKLLEILFITKHAKLLKILFFTKQIRPLTELNSFFVFLYVFFTIFFISCNKKLYFVVGENNKVIIFDTKNPNKVILPV